MLVYSARSADLTDRLDPTHYRPDLVAIELAVRSLGASTLDRWVERSGIGHTAAVTPHYADLAEPSVPFVSGAAIKDGTLDVTSAERVRIESHNSVMAASRLRPGMLVAVRKGELGNAGIVPPGLAEANCSSEVIFFHLRNRERAGYLASYFNSRHGRAVFLRQQRGMMIPSISLYDVPDILVPSPDGEVQRYIGSKVRQAEELREWARRVQARVTALHASLIPRFEVDGRRRNLVTIAPRRLRDVLTAESYPPDVQEYFGRHAHVRLADMCEVIFSGSTRPNAEAGDPAVDQATSRSCSGMFIRRPCNRVTPPNASADRFLARGDIMLSNAAHDRTYIGKDYTLFHGGPPNFPSTKVLVMRLAAGSLPTSYVHQVLSSPLGYRQTQAVVRGISAGISPDDVQDIRIPLPADEPGDRDAWFEADTTLYRIAGAMEVARDLTTSARLLVEALIERKVTEAELTAAGKDAEADRALLARLTEDGLDGVGAPLFSDLDGLAHLLHEATKDQ